MKKLELRVLQIDLGRQIETVEYLKEYIDFAKANDYNAVLLYIEAAIKVACTPFFRDDETFTPDQIREVVAYGNQQGIDIIPALENLAHIDNFLRYDELAYLTECEDAEVDGRGLWSGRGDCVCVSNMQARKFFDTYYEQVISLFTSKYVHAGMDEPFDFAVCPRCAERLKNGETKMDLFYEHLMHTYHQLKEMGKTMMMWDDFFQYMDVAEKLPRDIILCLWNYGHVSDEPGGFWLSQKKKDWFRYYDQLGFRYMFCTFAHPTAKLYNTDTFTAYAEKYNPMGAVMTVWERSSRFNLAGYPAIAYTGRFWNGKAKPEDKLKIYTEFLGSREAADIVLNLDADGPTYQPSNLVTCENITLARHLSTNVDEYASRKLKAIYDKMPDGLQKDILLDIYTITLDRYLAKKQHRICIEAFDNYESRSKRPAYFIKQFEELKRLSNENYELVKVMWEKYRPGVRSLRDQFANKYEGRAKRYDAMIQEVQKKEKYGVFYAELVLSAIWGTPRMTVQIHYKDKSVPVTEYTTSAKVADGVNAVRFRMENKPVDYVLFSCTGEGACYPCHFRYTCNGKKYMVSSATKVQGDVLNLKRVLLDDTQYAQMGCDDGQIHFEDFNVSKQVHTIKLKFKRLK